MKSRHIEGRNKADEQLSVSRDTGEIDPSPTASQESLLKVVFSKDDETLDFLNQDRDILKDGLIAEAWIVLIRVWLERSFHEGVVDIMFPTSEYSPCHFLEKSEALVGRSIYGAYRLYPRERGKDFAENFYPIIERDLLTPFSMGRLIPYGEHIFGKGRISKVVEYRRPMTRATVLENVEIISPLEFAQFRGFESDESTPDHYEDGLKTGGDTAIDYKMIISKGEDEKREFKSSARWDYRRNCMNKDEIQKGILKTVAGFLNASGGELFIGVDDNGSILGLEKDLQTLKKMDRDGYGLFLSDLMSEHIGKEYNSFIHIEFPEVEGVMICRVSVEKAKKPAFVREGSRNLFYVRTHNSTKEMDAKEATNYIWAHFERG